MPEQDEQPKKTKPGPEEERLKIDGDWEDAVKKALEKDRPEEGWPKAEQELWAVVERTHPTTGEPYFAKGPNGEPAVFDREKDARRFHHFKGLPRRCPVVRVRKTKDGLNRI